MEKECRRATRYVEMGRVDSPNLCHFSGLLLDISSTGCKVRFPMNLEIDLEEKADYELKIQSARKDFSDPFSLIGTPTWLKNFENSCEMGFSIIRSPSTREFQSFIKTLEEEKSALDEEEKLMSGFAT